MNEEQLRAFVQIVQHFFAQLAGRPAEVGTPFLGDPGSLPRFDFTGVIGISGSRHGCVYFTAPRELLRALLLHVGETQISDANLADLAGEIANTLAGNARRDFGQEFVISVPEVLQGAAQAIPVPKDVKAYVIPLRWHKHDAALVISVA
jgi:chemotaxis protein CheX